ncbi:MAG: hypothetical protein LBP53_02625 [Candidatus Peribacteria bacterium]|nr:hypothetical protein [Candidatus Peribacteria bacterium]
MPLLVENEPLTHDIQHKATILKSFIPLYNIKLRYQTPNFQSPYRRLKESILWRTIFSFFTLFFGSKMGSIIIAFLFIRLFLVLINIDIVPNNLKKLINHGFLIHPEEIIGYFRFPLPKKLRPAALKNISSEELKTTLITQAKQQYADMAGSNINHLLQYLTFGILIRQLFSTTSLTYELLLPTLAISLLVARALLTYHTYKKLPNIPLLHEVRSLIIK